MRLFMYVQPLSFAYFEQYLSTLTEATISADQTEYWVNEQDDLWITLHLDGQKGEGRECVVSVMTVDGTATGENCNKKFI